MKQSGRRSNAWRFEIEVQRPGSGSLCIKLRESDRHEIRFTSWEALYRYLSDRFPEWTGFLR